jgi:hypothetical protein
MISFGHTGVAEAHLRRCPKHTPGSPFSTDLDCKPCVYYAFGELNDKKIRQSLETYTRPEAVQQPLYRGLRNQIGLVVSHAPPAIHPSAPR